VERALVVGGGVMGAGIAGLLAQKGVRTRLGDVSGEALAKAKGRLQQDLDKRLRRRQLERHEAMAIQDRLAVATEWGRLERTDLWLEAVVEDLAVKQQLMAQAVARGLPPQAVIASNTSSLSIDAMASAVPQPERVVGIHFFNPPEKMPLCEVIRGIRTSDTAVATACRLAVQLGKFPVVVKDAPGFLVIAVSPLPQRSSAPAGRRQRAGVPRQGDARFRHADGTLPAARRDRFRRRRQGQRSDARGVRRAHAAEPAVPRDGRRACVGKKSGGGFYAGDKGGPGRMVLAQLRAARKNGTRHGSRSEVLQRLVYPMVDEAYRCLDDGIVQSEADLDLGLVMGIGFPPFTGGVTVFARSEGLRSIVAALDELARRVDPHFGPSDGLRRRAVE